MSFSPVALKVRNRVAIAKSGKFLATPARKGAGAKYAYSAIVTLSILNLDGCFLRPGNLAEGDRCLGTAQSQ
jgi:hypothetical protein